MGNIFAIAQLDMQRGPAPLLPSAVRDVLARRQKKLRLPNGSVVVMTPCAVDASAPPQGFSDLTYLRAQVEIAGGSVGGKALMLREPVRRDRIVTILPSGKVRPISTLRPPYSFPHVGRKRISEETGAARRG
jgi:hypothetical protein